MRLPVKNSARRIARLLIATSLAGTLSACGALGGGDGPKLASAPAMPSNGPQADYPVLVGDPYQIGGETFRPNDTLNYDEVGYLTVDSGARGFTGSHHTLPVPSYVEVTSLTTGRTILVRLERRGPMASNHLVALSPAALAQLDATPETPVRVRRMNAPEEQRAQLRSGQSAPARMDTPMSLVNVLRRRLPAAGAAPVPSAEPVVAVARAPAPAPSPSPTPTPTARPTPAPSGPPPLPPIGSAPLPTVHTGVPAPAPTPAPRAAAVAEAGFYVQAAAFSTEDRARRAANALGGQYARAGNLFRVRTGPFPTRAAAEASLANVRAAGYSDARILTEG